MPRRNPLFFLVFLILSIGVIGAETVLCEDTVLDENTALDKNTVFGEHIGVEIVNIDVVVVDKKGRAVSGLTEDDFELRIDGQKVPTANFYALTAAPSAQPPREISLPEAGAETSNSKTEDSGTSDEVPLHLIAYIESFYLTPISRKRVLADLPDFFEQQIANGTRIMLVTHDRTIRVLTPFTNDLAELRSSLETIQEAPAVGIQQKVARRRVIDNITQIYQQCDENPRLNPCTDCLGQMVEMARFYSQG